MDKNAIKKYAVWARKELITRVTQKAEQYEITEKKTTPADADSIGGRVLTAAEKKQRQALIAKINQDGFEQVMEEVAYTWFNRFTALRFMEANNYLPSHTRVFTNENGEFKPQILADAIQLDLEGLNMDKVFALKDANKTEELYKYLLITQCNALSGILPRMFQKIEDYTELLLPDYLLREGSVIEQMIALIPEEDWTDQVQIIGWLYQYYNSEKKDDVFAALKKNVKITKENIPAATQLFTPDWIVRYMVENSLGRLWLEGHPDVKEQFLPTEEEQSAYADGNRDLEDTKWHYYLEEAEQEPEVQAQLAEIRKEYAALTPDQLKVIDPCSGSGHILAYMFDVLMKIYESYGYTTREAVASIVENNLYGLDIDDRAVQLAYFAVMMKARQYDRRFFIRGIQPHVYAIVESNHVDKFAVDYFCNGDAKLKAAMDTILSELHDAKEYGSILTVTPQDWTALYARFAEIMEDINMSRETALRELLPLVQVAEALAQKYDAVVTNPPYMGASGMCGKLSSFVKKIYPDTKSDMSTIMMERMLEMCTVHGYISMINIPVWMFLSSYEKMRNIMLHNNTIVNLVHPGRGIFGSDFGTTSFVVSKTHIKNYVGRYHRLFDSQGEVHSVEERRNAFLQRKGLYTIQQENFFKIPGMPIAYWLHHQIYEMYGNYKTMAEIATPKVGMQTSNNDRYLRLWHEVDFSEFNASSYGLKWIKYLKGGAYRKWYGNLEYLLFYNKTPDFILQQKNARVLDLGFLKKKKCTWTDLTISKNSFRIAPDDTFYDISGHCFFPKEEDQLWLLGYANTLIFAELLKVFNSTIHCQVGDVGKIIVPDIGEQKNKVSVLAGENVEFSKKDWDSFETSWDFRRHPLLRKVSTIAEAFDRWQSECDVRFNQLKANEEELNRIFIDIYGLQDDLTPEVEDKDVTVCKADLGRDIRSFISYAVGCMFGRYSLAVEGLVYAGGEWPPMDKAIGVRELLYPEADPNICSWMDAYGEFCPDIDNIIPICDDEYYDDDIVGRFVEFVKTVYGEDTLDENLKFIADVLGGKGQPKDVIRNYFLNDFYKDHCKIYQKRPIYWLFDSGKKNGFKALIYMHRYQPDTIARIRTDYVHEQQSRYRTAIVDLERQINAAPTSERVKLNKQLAKLQAQAEEVRIYEEKIHHLADQFISIDLDDGVKKNYAIFADVLAKIK
ncbi:MAG: BREX-1 system adenine-specific DNA-methyltransferase PglX [Eubacteriales bacterium]|nr:BREX-1 system adenine-specific DNA-methyltransferase PglX [Eubacteriales bacterium]